MICRGNPASPIMDLDSKPLHVTNLFGWWSELFHNAVIVGSAIGAFSMLVTWPTFLPKYHPRPQRLLDLDVKKANPWE